MMEHKLVETAKAFLKESKDRSLVLPQIHSKQAERHQSGMICSGEQTVLLYQLKTGDLADVQEIISSELKHSSLSFSIRPAGFSTSQATDSEEQKP